MTEKMIRVKLLSRVEPRIWLRQFPGGQARWSACHYLFDPDVRNYDWLVVYDDLPPIGNERFSLRREYLSCSRSHTLLVTTEPSSIKAYGKAYVDQFGWVLSSQEDWALQHPGKIYSQAALRWFYGVGRGHAIGYDSLHNIQPFKQQTLSTVCSGKRQRHTLHNQRYQFIWGIKERIPELEVFGRGVRNMDDKAEALDDFRYHIAIENHVALHHWTEKLADAFLGFTLPFYYGCPNFADYFPRESLVPIDIFDPRAATEVMLRAIKDGFYEQRLPAIKEARRRVLEEFNIFAVLSAEIEQRYTPSLNADGSCIYSRRSINRKTPWNTLQHLAEKTRQRLASSRHMRG